MATASYLSSSIFRLAEVGGIPPEKKQKAGEEAIMYARQALEIHTRLSADNEGMQSEKIAGSVAVLAQVTDFFNNVDDEETLRLRKQAISMYRRIEGPSSSNVDVLLQNLGNAYAARANRAFAANVLDRQLASLESALTHYRESAQIHQANNHVERANDSLGAIARAEDALIRSSRAIAATKVIAAIQSATKR